MKKQLTLMLAVGLLLVGCLPPKKGSEEWESKSGEASKFKSVEALGKAAFKAFQSKDPDRIVALFPDIDERIALKKTMIESTDDPLAKIKIERSFGEDVTQERFDRDMARVFDKIYQFLVSVDNGEGELSYEQLRESTFLGLAPLDVDGKELTESFGIDGRAIGLESARSARLFLEHDGVVFSITIDALLKIDHHWYLSGDHFDLTLIFSSEDVYFDNEAALHPEAKRVRGILISHFAKYSNREYAALVERHLNNRRRRPRPEVDFGRGNTTQSD